MKSWTAHTILLAYQDPTLHLLALLPGTWKHGLSPYSGIGEHGSNILDSNQITYRKQEFCGRLTSPISNTQSHTTRSSEQSQCAGRHTPNHHANTPKTLRAPLHPPNCHHHAYYVYVSHAIALLPNRQLIPARMTAISPPNIQHAPNITILTCNASPGPPSKHHARANLPGKNTYLNP
jgi:hypothetical protein